MHRIVGFARSDAAKRRPLCKTLCARFPASVAMGSIQDLTSDELTRVLAYAGFVLVGYELVKSMIVNPIKLFYKDVTFGKGLRFSSYEEDVLLRHRNEFEACLFYLRDFMEAVDSEDVLTIQALRKHRNELAHDLVGRLANLRFDEYQSLFEKVDPVLFKLSNYRMYMEMGADPEFQNTGIDWATAKGHEYLLFEEIVAKVKLLNLSCDGA